MHYHCVYQAQTQHFGMVVWSECTWVHDCSQELNDILIRRKDCLSILLLRCWRNSSQYFQTLDKRGVLLCLATGSSKPRASFPIRQPIQAMDSDHVPSQSTMLLCVSHEADLLLIETSKCSSRRVDQHGVLLCSTGWNQSNRFPRSPVKIPMSSDKLFDWMELVRGNWFKVEAQTNIILQQGGVFFNQDTNFPSPDLGRFYSVWWILLIHWNWNENQARRLVDVGWMDT